MDLIFQNLFFCQQKILQYRRDLYSRCAAHTQSNW